jgi:hypothetical protein
MSCGFEAKLRVSNDLGYVLFSKVTTRLRVALESMLDGEEHTSIKLDAKLHKVPFIVGIINTDISRDIWRRRIIVGINNISSVDTVVNDRSEANKETRDRLLDTRRVGLGKFLYRREGTRQTIAPVAGTMLALWSHSIIPQGVENNHTFGSKTRLTIIIIAQLITHVRG